MEERSKQCKSSTEDGARAWEVLGSFRKAQREVARCQIKRIPTNANGHVRWRGVRKGAKDVEGESAEQMVAAKELVQAAMLVPGGLQEQLERIPEDLRQRRVEAKIKKIGAQGVGGIRTHTRMLKKLEAFRAKHNQGGWSGWLAQEAIGTNADYHSVLWLCRHANSR